MASSAVTPKEKHAAHVRQLIMDLTGIPYYEPDSLETLTVLVQARLLDLQDQIDELIAREVPDVQP